MYVSKFVGRSVVVLLVIAGAGLTIEAQDSDDRRNAVQKPKPRREARESVIARSTLRVPVDVRSMNLATGPTGPGSFPPGATVECTHVNKKMSGASPKFSCKLADGEEVKVKYGGTNGEVYGEVAATRLLWALGFGADHMYSVRVVCRGCPREVVGIRRDNGDLILDPAAIERKMPGKELLDAWDWAELDKIDASSGGASTAERDALKLLAVLLQHTDSKPVQQRVICVAELDEDGRCATPLMMVQDVGITFGQGNAFNTQPKASVNLAGWIKLPIWKGGDACVGNLGGSFKGTLKNPVISEAGRALLADLLMQLSDEQLHDMFEAARVHLRPRAPESGLSGFPAVAEWVDAFKMKRAEIVNRRCA